MRNRKEECGENIITGLNCYNRVLLGFNYSGLLFNLPRAASITQKGEREGSCFQLICATEEEFPQ